MVRGEPNFSITGAMQNSTTTATNNANATTSTTATATISSRNVVGVKSDGQCCSFDNEDEYSGNAGNSGERQRSNSILPSYLILSPSNPLRILAISLLTHWIYYTVISVTVCAFVISLVYCRFQKCTKSIIGQWEKNNDDDDVTALKFLILEVSRWALFITILLEILIKSIARGFFVGSKFAYLRILWDWMDVASLALIFLSIIIPRKTVEFTAAAVVLLKLIPIHSGSINAFIFLCSCAKKLIPVLLYGLIIVWIYGFIIFTLFVKYHPQQDLNKTLTVENPSLGATHSNRSSNDVVVDEKRKGIGNSNLTNVVGLGDGYGSSLSTSTAKEEQIQNFSLGLSMECLPTKFRSLSGSFIQTMEMLTLRYSQDKALGSSPSLPSSGTETLILNATKTVTNNVDGRWSCQYEIYTLSIMETLVIISGTLPMIIMSFSVLSHFFLKTTKLCSTSNSSDQYHHQQTSPNENDKDNGEYFYRRHRESIESRRAAKQNNFCFNIIANSCCDCDYYFCCLANLQRKLYPCASGILNSKKFKVLVILILSTDFLCMINLLWFSNSKSTSDIDFPTTWLIEYYYIQICFVLYTVEAVFRWVSISSDEYWMTIWPAFDLTLVFVYWIVFGILHIWSYQNYYLMLCGVLMVRMLKIVPYWKSLEHTLKLIVFSVMRNRCNLLVILVCSCSCFLVKCAIYLIEGRWGSYVSSEDLIPFSSSSSLPHDFYTFVDSIFRLFLYFFCGTAVVTLHAHIFNNLKNSQNEDVRSLPTTRNPSITVFLSNGNSYNHDDINFDEMGRTASTQDQNHLSEFSSSPISVMSIPNGNAHHNSKYRLANSPSCNSAMLSNDTRSSILSPSSDVLSPLLSLPVPNGLNGHIPHHSPTNTLYFDNHEDSSQLGVGESSTTRPTIRRDSYLYLYQRASAEDLMNIISGMIVILASTNTALDSNLDDTTQMNWQSIYPGRSLWLEVFFIMSIAIHIIFKTRLSRFSRHTFMQIASVIDIMVILAAAVEVFSYGMTWMPSSSSHRSENIFIFLKCAKILSASRGLLILSRISWLKCIGSGLCYILWKAVGFVGAIFYILIITIISATEAQKMMQTILQGKHETNATLSDETNVGNSTKDEQAPSPFLSTKQYTTLNEENILHPIFIFLLVILFLLSLAVVLGFLRYQLGNLGQLTQKFMTNSQTSCKKPTDSAPCHLSSFIEYSSKPRPQEPTKPTKGICVPILYFVANHRTFDIIVMTVILFDALGITFEYFYQSERALILRKHYPAYMLFLYILEIGSKLVGNGLHFFKSYWNIFDCANITICTIDFFVTLVSPNWIPLLVQNLRFFRILRIFQFYPFTKRTKLIYSFFQMLVKSNLLWPMWNFLVFYFCLHLGALAFMLRCSASFLTKDQTIFTTTPWPAMGSPLDTVDFSLIFQTGLKVDLSHYTIDKIFYFCGQILFAIIKITVVFTVCFMLILLLCKYLTDNDNLRNVNSATKISHSRSHSHSFHHDDEGDDDDIGGGHVDYEDKISFMMPCISPSETIDIETPSSSGGGTATRPNYLNVNTISRSLSSPSPSATKPVAENTEVLEKPNSLYKTTTITSSEEINGCKVFFVEAMITTV